MNNTKVAMWFLRVGLAGSFIAHGIFAVLGEEEFLKWIMDFTNTDVATGAKLLLAVGVMDILVGISMLFKPVRFVILWAFIWTFWTSIMIIFPFIGEPVLEVFEHMIMPASAMALLILLGWPKNIKGWLK